MSNPPALSAEQRKENLEKGLEVRRARAAIKNAIKAQTKTIEWALEQPECQGMYVKQLIMSVPMFGRKRTEKVMKELGIPDNRRVRGMNEVKKQQLLWRVS